MLPFKKQLIVIFKTENLKHTPLEIPYEYLIKQTP